jgi:hypothetical protein
MKKAFYTLSVLISLAGIFSCGSFIEQDVVNYNSVSNVITQGEWRVNQYLNNSQDETNDFVGLTLQFKSNGIIVATNTTQVINGSWVEDKISKNIIINFNNTDPILTKIADTWSINSKDVTKVRMIETNTQNEVLGIEKK